MVTRIGHTAIRARDIEATARFYTEVLGFKEAFRMYSKEEGKLSTIYIYIAPYQFIEIFPGGTEEAVQDRQCAIGHSHICYEVDDLAAYQEEVRARGAPIDVELKTGFSKCLQFWTHDPDGNRMEFMQLPPESLQFQAVARIMDEEAAGKNELPRSKS
ncbi:MAG: VOC family protein [Treponema sp.]|jgi:lactoylglutathione lyase|nr:VOC family protein [Treponema sp.]